MTLAADAKQPHRLRAKSRRESKLDRRAARERFRRVHRAAKRLERQLKKVAVQVGKIVRGFAPGGIVGSMMPQINRSLQRYADMLRPWAEEVSQQTVAEVAQRDMMAWGSLGEEIGRNLRAEIRGAPTGAVMKEKIDERVDLITSLPREAAKRVHKLTIEGMAGGVRAKATAREIARTGLVTKNRAMLIARTETTSTATALVEARARYIGSPGYFWRTVGDVDVRDRHKHLEGEFITWDRPPVAGESGERYHAGAGPNCRCWPEPVVPDVMQ